MRPDAGKYRVEKGLWTLILEQFDVPKTFLGLTLNTTRNSITFGPAGPAFPPIPSDNLEHHLRQTLSGRWLRLQLRLSKLVRFLKTTVPLWAIFLSRFSEIFWTQIAKESSFVWVICFMTHTLHAQLCTFSWEVMIFSRLKRIDWFRYNTFFVFYLAASEFIQKSFHELLPHNIVNHDSVLVTNNII